MSVSHRQEVLFSPARYQRQSLLALRVALLGALEYIVLCNAVSFTPIDLTRPPALQA